MDIQAFAPFEQALKARALRNEVLASNIANADTPNYKARDVDFGSALRQAQGGIAMQKTNVMHREAGGMLTTQDAVKYRIPTQPTLDGNTVETDVEQAAFAENALMYRASLSFLSGQIRTLRYAIKGSE